MIDINLNGAEPTHVDRIKPQFSIDSAGNISWQPGFVDYDASVFHRGKVVTNDEYNTLFLKNVYQGNYNADSLNTLLKEHLGTIIHRKFTSLFNIKDSYAKVFSQSDWGAQQADGYYYITIPVIEHGFEPNTDKLGIDQVTIDTEMYVLDTNGNLVELPQVSVALDNTVTAYTDDNTLTGFIIVRLNDKAVVYADVKIDASQVIGLEEIAMTGQYADLKGLNEPDGPNYRLSELEHKFSQLSTGELPVAKATEANTATDANNLTGTIRNISLDDIFEPGSSIVKTALIAHYASGDGSKGTIEERLHNLDSRLISLGFKEGNITSKRDGSVVGKIYRQGNIAWGSITIPNSSDTLYTLQIPDGFVPTTTFIDLINVQKANGDEIISCRIVGYNININMLSGALKQGSILSFGYKIA